MRLALQNHTVTGNWVQDLGGFGLYSNGVGPGDLRYNSPQEADVNHGHVIANNLFVDGGRQIEYGTGVWLYQTGETRIVHNVIHRFPRGGQTRHFATSANDPTASNSGHSFSHVVSLLLADAVGFYGILPFWTADPGGPAAPSTAPSNSSSRKVWGRFVTWDGANTTDGQPAWSTWDILYNKNNCEHPLNYLYSDPSGVFDLHYVLNRMLPAACCQTLAGTTLVVLTGRAWTAV